MVNGSGEVCNTVWMPETVLDKVTWKKFLPLMELCPVQSTVSHFTDRATVPHIFNMYGINSSSFN